MPCMISGQRNHWIQTLDSPQLVFFILFHMVVFIRLLCVNKRTSWRYTNSVIIIIIIIIIIL